MKVFYFFSSILMILGFYPIQAQEYLPDSNTVALWHFNETAGDTVYDTSGHGNNGLSLGTSISIGRFGNGRAFDGSDHDIVVPSNPISAYVPYTVEGWVNVIPIVFPLDGWKRIFSSGLGWEAIIKYTNFGLQVGGVAYIVDEAVQPRRWYHIAVEVFANKIVLYINGFKRISVPYSIPSYTGQFEIGGQIYTHDYFYGLIDEVRISNKARDPVEFNLGPYISSISDIPNDQGGKVRIKWNRCLNDSLDSPYQITGYGIWRKIPTGEQRKFKNHPFNVLNDTLGVLYDFIMTVPAVQSPEYNVVAPTLNDSSYSGIHRFTYLVTAHTSDPNIYFISDADSGYSVDNLSPSIVIGLNAIVQSGPTVQLNWDKNTTDPDVGHYDIYRSTTGGFIPNPTLRIGTSIGDSFIDTLPVLGAINYYRVVAVDIHGNESPASSQVQATITIINASNMLNGWNLVSLPLNVSDNRRATLFPTAASSAYIYRGTYLSQDTIHPGVGFWLKFNTEQIVRISGLPIMRDTVDVLSGWNIIGSISQPVTSVISIPPNIRISNFFKYTGIYQISDTIYPGRGYWVKMNQAGKLILAVNSPEVSAGLIKLLPITELPPSPPGEEMSTAERAIPTEYALQQAYPSPFNPSTTIRYQLPEDSRVSLLVYNTLGQVVAVLADGIQQAGYKQVEWNAGSVASGVYFYRLEATSVTDPSRTFTQVRKALFIK